METDQHKSKTFAAVTLSALALSCALLLGGCGSAISPEVMSVTLDMITEAAKQAKEHGQSLPKFARDCDIDYIPGVEYDTLEVLCAWRIPRAR